MPWKTNSNILQPSVSWIAVGNDTSLAEDNVDRGRDEQAEPRKTRISSLPSSRRVLRSTIENHDRDQHATAPMHCEVMERTG